ncbi:MAG: hypothetical protein IT436_13145, partial [Phycisphaerales bacterium]|nr:hypothetical protein [Phycisphaerales bacterium]
HRITGTGRLFSEGGGTLTNFGTLLGNRAGGLHIDCPVANHAVVRAVPPGALSIGGVIFQHGSGYIEADGARVTLENQSDINQGVVRGVNGGTVEVAGTAYLSNVTTEGNWVIRPSPTTGYNTLSVDTSWTNNGLVRLPDNPSHLNHNRLRIATDGLVIQGTGEIRLEETPPEQGAELVLDVGDGTVTNGPGHSITGAGWLRRLDGDETLVNEGTILANRTPGRLVVDVHLNNRGTLRAVAGGRVTLWINNTTQSEDGLIEADGGTVELLLGEISGGTVRSKNGGVVTVQTGLLLRDVTSEGYWTVDEPPGFGDGVQIYARGTWINDAVIDVPVDAAKFFWILPNPQLTIDGNGEIRMNLRDYQAMFSGGSGTEITNGTHHRISGTPRITGGVFRNAGTLAPGMPFGTILARDAGLFMLPTSILEIELGGPWPTKRDLLDATGQALPLGGTLRVLLRDEYVPPACEEITVVRGNISGAFDVHELPIMPQGLMHVTYLATEVRVGYVPGDMNGDGLLDFADYLEFLNLYEATDARADLTGDGLVDFGDYLEFLNLLNGGC